MEARPDRKHNILYVDDEANNLVVFRNVFFRYYHVFTATSGEEALALMDQKPMHVVITDQKMPGLSGVEFLEKSMEKHPEVVRMVLTAYSDIDIIMRAINRCGIYQYVLKPWDNRQLKITIDNAIQKYELTHENRTLIKSLKETNKSLEEKVRERTATLAQQNEQLSELVAVRDKLFSILSHDLKMPTAALNVLLDILIHFNEQMDHENLLEYCRKSKRYIQHVIDLMDNLLQWSSAQTGSLSIQTKPIHASELFSELEGIFSFIAHQKGQSLKFPKDDPNAVLHCDKNLTLLILRNLLSNAIKFTRQSGSIELVIEPNGERCKIKIIDTGVGIAPEVIQKLNAGSFTESKPGTNEEKGIGLGLKLCHEFALLQSGQLNLESTYTGGIMATLILPMAK